MTISNIYLLQGLREEQKKYVMAQMERKGKDTAMAYAFFLLLGAHYFYLKKPLKNILYWITMGGLGIWGIIDLFRMKSLVENTNMKILQELIVESKFITNNKP